MVGITNPPHPRPHKVVFDDDSFAFITCGLDPTEGVEIFDYDSGNGYTPLSPNTTTSYTLKVGGSIIVIDGIIQ